MLVFLGNLTPKEHTHLLLVEGAAKGCHYLLGNLTTAAVGCDICLTMPFYIIVLQGFSSSQLDAAECSAVDITLDFQNPRDECLVGAAHSHTPSGHVVTF